MHNIQLNFDQMTDREIAVHTLTKLYTLEEKVDEKLCDGLSKDVRELKDWRTQVRSMIKIVAILLLAIALPILGFLSKFFLDVYRHVMP